MDGEKALWKEVLREKYGPSVTSMLDGSLNQTWRSASIWWKDVVNLGNFGSQGWFNSEMQRVIGDGMYTSFWNDKWCREGSLRRKYPRLFAI